MSGAAASSSRPPRPAEPERAGTAQGAATVGAALDAATRELAAAGCDTPRLDAELLLAQVLDVDRARLFADGQAPLAAPAGAAFDALVRRRRAREPVAYITGRRGFRRLDLAVDARVLVPRPETELLVEVALDLPAGARVVDVGTGSGAVALALADERPDVVVTATDRSPGAVAVARDNATRLGLDVRFVEADLLPAGEPPPDAIVSNPPYVPDAELAGLEPEIVRHEPRLALAGGPDGLDVIRRLVARTAGVRFVALEVGAGQAGAVGGLLRDAGFGDVATARDLAGIERVVVGRRGG